MRKDGMDNFGILPRALHEPLKVIWGGYTQGIRDACSQSAPENRAYLRIQRTLDKNMLFGSLALTLPDQYNMAASVIDERNSAYDMGQSHGAIIKRILGL